MQVWCEFVHRLAEKNPNNLLTIGKRSVNVCLSPADATQHLSGLRGTQPKHSSLSAGDLFQPSAQRPI